MPRHISLVVIASLVLTVTAGAGASAEGAVRRVALGVSEQDDQSITAVEAYKTAAGRYPALWASWSDWGGPDRDFPTTFFDSLRARGIVPMVNWQPVAPGSEDCTRWSLDNIIRGDYDAYVRQWATAAKQFGGRVIVRFAHEMNGYWFTWGYSRCGNTPAKYKEAWRHVWNIFRGPSGVGATNVKFLWSIYGAYKLKAHFPGNAYVDYVGFTAFNWGPPTHEWGTMVSNFGRSMRALLYLTRKPIIAAEMGAAYLPDCSICNKTAYISNGYPAVYKKWPRLKAIVYFDLDMTFVGQPNWRLDSPESALAAYRQVVADTRFQGRIR